MTHTLQVCLLLSILSLCSVLPLYGQGSDPSDLSYTQVVSACITQHYLDYPLLNEDERARAFLICESEALAQTVAPRFLSPHMREQSRSRSQTTTGSFEDCSLVTTIPQSECKALVALYDSTGGPNWTDETTWLQASDPCSCVYD